MKSEAEIRAHMDRLKRIIADGESVWGLFKLNECRARIWALEWVLA